MNNSIKWKTRTIHHDEDTGELIENNELKNYIIIKTEKHASVQNGHGTVEYSKQCRRIYKSDLFGTSTQ